MANLKRIIFLLNIIGLLLCYIIYNQVYKLPKEYLMAKLAITSRQQVTTEGYLYLFRNQHPKPNIEEAVFEVDTPGCRIPWFDQFDPSVKHFFIKVGNWVCPASPRVVTANRTHLLINNSVMVGVYSGNVSCFYKKIWRTGEGVSDNWFGIDSKKQRFSDSVEIFTDFVRVQCVHGKNKSICFQDFFAFTPVKKKVETECTLKYNQWMKETNNTIIERLNVVITGIDSVSRLNMLRHMTKTREFLIKNFNPIDLHGYNKVGDNTFPNIVPMLSGLDVEECWNDSFSEHSLDYLNLVWKDFKQRGYRTFYSEDTTEITPFNYLKAGFFYPPTDYYYRPLNVAMEKSSMVKACRANCLYNQTAYTFYLDWLLKYLETFRDRPRFAFLFNSQLTHSGINRPGYADDIFYRFFKKFYDSGFINDTVLIFLSDHGLRFGDFRKTYIGKLEERLPFFFLMLPPWFENKYPEMWKNLRVNERRLTTPFDIYETLQDLINFTGKIRKFNSSNRGISLFSEIYPERSCKDAGIRPHWCTCRVSKIIAVNETIVILAANHLISDLNKLLTSEINCSQLKLAEILDARVSVTNDNILRYEKSSDDVLGRNQFYGEPTIGIIDYILVVKTTPGDALIEGTLRYSEVTHTFDVTADVSRINVIGTNPIACSTNVNLHKFCVCKKKVAI